LPKGHARKLLPKYISPMKIIHVNPSTDTYTLELPKQLQEQCIHPTFHVNLLCHHEPNDNAMFPRHDAHVFYSEANTTTHITKAKWDSHTPWCYTGLKFLVKWSLGDSTWEPYLHCKDLEALDRYLELHGVEDPHQLPKHSQQDSAL
ncbi:hypothetical protein PISMIDRAFT_101004, partial [Pisolithus microcarpus 441]